MAESTVDTPNPRTDKTNTYPDSKQVETMPDELEERMRDKYRIPHEFEDEHKKL